jgi:superfamily II DNA or RNA helicase
MTSITGDIPVAFWEDLSLRMSYEVPGAFYSEAAQNGHWDGRKKLFNKRWLAFPTGLFNLFRDACTDHGIAYVINDTRKKPASGILIPIKGISLRDYQLEAADKALAKQRGMIRVATGGGKTEIIAELIGRTNVKTLVLIHKQDIFYQLVDRLGKRLGVPIGQLGCGIIDPQDITVGMIQTVHRAYGGTMQGLKDIDNDKTVISKPEIIQSLVEKAECVIIDEAHHVSSSIFGKVLTKCEKAYYRWGFSASPWREDNADLLLDAHTGARCVDVSASELIKRGYLSKPTIYLYEYDHGRPNAFGYPHMYEQQVVNNTFRNKIVVRAVLKALAHNKSCLIAVTRIEHGRMLEAMLKQCVPGNVKFASGQVDSIERRQILQDLADKKVNVVIATTVFGEGIDCPTLDVLINAKANKSSIDSLQLVGRALRKTSTKDKVTIIDIYDDHCKYLGTHAKDRLKIYKTEPEFIIKKIKDPDQIIFPA